MPSRALEKLTVEPGRGPEIRSTKAFDIEILQTADAISRVRDEWTEFLTNRAGSHNAFHHPDIVQHDLREHPEIYTPFILIMRRRGQIQGIAPWYVHRMRFPLKLGVINIVRVPFRLLKLYGGSMITDRDIDPDATIRQAFESARGWRREFDLIALFDIPAPGPLWDVVQSEDSGVPGFHVIPATKEPVVKRGLLMPETFEEFMGSLGSKKRNSLRRNERRLREKSNETLTFERVTDPQAISYYLEEVEFVYQRSWQGRTMGGHRSSEAQIRFLETVAQNGWFRSYIVRCQSQPICFGLGYQYDGVYYGEDMGYDVEWRHCAPGNFMFVKLVEDLFAHDTPKIIDFGTGDNLFKQEYSNTSSAAQTLYLAPKGALYGASVIRTQRLVDWVYRVGHAIVSRLGIDGWVRDRIKRKKKSK